MITNNPENVKGENPNFAHDPALYAYFNWQLKTLPLDLPPEGMSWHYSDVDGKGWHHIPLRKKGYGEMKPQYSKDNVEVIELLGGFKSIEFLKVNDIDFATDEQISRGWYGKRDFVGWQNLDETKEDAEGIANQPYAQQYENFLKYLAGRAAAYINEKVTVFVRDVKTATPYTLYQKGLDLLSKSLGDVNVYFDGATQTGGYTVERRVESKMPEGVNVEYSLAKVPFAELCEFVESIPEDLKKLRKLMSGLINPPSPSNLLYVLGSLLQSYEPKKHLYKFGGTIGASTHEKIIHMPVEAQLDPRLQGVSIAELLPIFKGADLEAATMAIGRIFTPSRQDTLVGSQSRLLPEGYKTSYRKLPVIVGEPRIGKSVLIEAITEVAQLVGLRTTGIPDELRNFSGAMYATSHLCYNDDFDGSGLGTFLKSSGLKTMVANFSLPTEEKFMSPTTTQSRTAMIIALNEVILPDNIDKGALDRLMVISCERHSDLNGKNLYQAWEEMSSNLGLPIDALKVALMVKCAAKFLECQGFTVNEGGKINYQKPEISLEKALDSIVDKLKHQNTPNRPDMLVQAALKAQALVYVSNKQWSKLPSGTEHFNSQTYAHLAYVVYKLASMRSHISIEFLNQLREWLLPGYGVFHRQAWGRMLDVADQQSRACGMSTPAKELQAIISQIALTNNSRMSWKAQDYCSGCINYKEYQYKVEGYAKEWSELLETHEEGQKVKLLLEFAPVMYMSDVELTQSSYKGLLPIVALDVSM